MTMAPPQRVPGDGPVGVDVPPEIVERAREVAAAKQVMTITGKIRHRREYSSRSPIEAAMQDVEAVIGEYALTSMLGIPFDADQLERGVGDGGIDQVPYRHWNIQVKSTTAWVPALWTPEHYQTPAHLFVVTWRPAAEARLIAALVRVHVIGWVTRKMWEQRRTTERTHWGARWKVAREDLEPASTLAFLPDRVEALR